jgi:hypothetical protein
MSYKITSFELPVKLDDFCSIFWYENDWYEDFMANTLKDINITIGEWKDHEDKSLVRNLKSDHPSKVSFPGLPSHATSMKIQKMKINSEAKNLTIIESNNFDGIPYSDYFRVDTVWQVEEAVSMFMGSSTRCTRVSITGEVVFVKSTWLKGSIESNTKAELQTVYASWEEEAVRHIKTRFKLSDMISEPPGVVTNVQLPPFYEDDQPRPSLSRANSTASMFSSDDERFYDCEEGSDPSGSGEFDGGDGDVGGGDDETFALLRDVRVRQARMRAENFSGLYGTPLKSRRSTGSGDHSDGDSDNDLEMGYSSADSQAEETSVRTRKRRRGRMGVPHESPMHLLTPKELIDLYGKSGKEAMGGLGSRGRVDLTLEDKPVSRVVAITVAEVLYVLAESSFWQVS